MAPSKQLTGAAGEYFVAAELSRRGWAASITPKGVDRTDILAQHLETGSVIAVQVKATTTGTEFTLNVNSEASSDGDNEWFALVGFTSKGDSPTYHLLPRNHVAFLIYTDHRVWLEKPSKSGARHKDTSRRLIRAKHLVDGLGAWDCLTIPTSEIPLRLSPYYASVVADADRHGIAPPERVPELSYERAAQPEDGPAATRIREIWERRAPVEVVEPTATWLLNSVRTTFPPLPKEESLRQARALAEAGMLPTDELEQFEAGIDQALVVAWDQMEAEGMPRSRFEDDDKSDLKLPASDRQ